MKKPRRLKADEVLANEELFDAACWLYAEQCVKDCPEAGGSIEQWADLIKSLVQSGQLVLEIDQGARDRWRFISPEFVETRGSA